MLRILTVLLLLVQYGAAQIRDLATNDDGTVLAFDSFWRLAGSQDDYSPKVYRYDQTGWSVVARSATLPVSNPDKPFLTGDARIIGWERVYPCSTGSCPFGNIYTTELTGVTRPILIPYSEISHNGVFLATPGSGTPLSQFGAAVQNLSTGQVWTGAALSGISPGAQVGDDGTILGGAPTGTAVLRWRPDQPLATIFDSGVQVRAATLSGDGKRALFAAASAPGNAGVQLWLVDLQSGSRVPIAGPDLPAAGSPAGLSLSVDGRRAAFYTAFADGSHSQLFVWDEASGQTIPLAQFAEGLPSTGAIALSGNGSILWVVTNSNRLLRFDLDQGTNQEVQGAFPGLLSYVDYVSKVPGSAIHLIGGDPLPGEHFRLNGLEFPVLPTQPGEGTVVQIPWDLDPLTTPPGQLIVTRDGSPFELDLPFALLSVAPQFEHLLVGSQYQADLVKASSQDFTHLITTATPALPGETVAVWMTGLGPLDRPVPTGAPGPSNPPSHPLAHLECYMLGPQNNPALRGVALPYIGYAADQVGVYQVNLTIPADWPAGSSLVSCVSGTAPLTAGHLSVGSR